MGLQEALSNIWSSDYVQKNPNKAYKVSYQAEYSSVAAFLNGGPEPNWSNFSKLGKGLCEAEKHRRGEIIVTPDPVPPVTGDKFAAPNGNDANAGTLASPFKTVRKLIETLQAGQTGMLRAGTYGDYSTWHGGPSYHGTATQRITLTNYPGEKATIVGYFGAGKDYWTIRNLYFNTTNVGYHSLGSQALDIGGRYMIFENNDVYQEPSVNAGNAVLVGAGAALHDGSGDNMILRYNRIHDFGKTGNLDHGFYHKDGQNVQIYGNWIWHDAHGWGIQVYPGPRNSVYHSNVIDKCGSGFVIADDGGSTVLNNDVYNNVIINSVGLTFTGGCGLSGSSYSTGGNNKFRDNICFNNPGGIRGELEGYTWCEAVQVSGNTIIDPMFVDAANHNYLLKSGSPAASYGLPTTKPGPSV